MAPPRCDFCLNFSIKKELALYSNICCIVCNLKCCAMHAYPCMCGCKRYICRTCYNQHSCKEHGWYYTTLKCPTDCPWCSGRR